MKDILKIISIIVAVTLAVLLFYKLVEEIKDNFEEKNLKEDPYVLELIEEIKNIDPRVENVVKNLKFYEGRKSYTINKSKVYLCMRDKNGEIYQKNQLILVLIHEISHALCDEIGHTEKFSRIFEDLLNKATKKGIYNPRVPHISDYCDY